MKKIGIITFVIILVIILGIYSLLKSRGMEKLLINPTDNISGAIPLLNKKAVDETGKNLVLPDGFKISIYSKDLENPRDLILDANNTLLVSIPSQGKVVKLPEGDVVVEKLNRPHGLAFFENKLFIAETDSVSVFDYDLSTKKASNKKKILDLPAGGNHYTRSILLKDNKIYVSTGSSCNVCDEKDPRRAAVWIANLDGSNFKSFATGLRNSVFMILHPKTNEIWATEMGRDLLGDNTPPEEVNIIKENNHYGWPYCYANKILDQETNPNNSKFNCNNSIAPHLSFQAHSAPLGLAFFENDLLVAYHGSWNRKEPTGYKMVKFALDENGNKQGEPIDFITGWIKDRNVSGRPVDVLVDKNKIYISDDYAGVVYLIEKQ